MSSALPYTRVGGWLLLPLLYLIATLISASAALYLYAMGFIDPGSQGYLSVNANIGSLSWYLSLLTSMVMWLYTLWLIILFCRRSRRFPRLLVIWLLLTIALALKTYAFVPGPDDVALKSLLFTLLPAALLAPAIMRSERAKKTFIEP